MTARDGNDGDRADWGADPELLDVLRDADPARSLPPLTSAELSRLVARAAETTLPDGPADDIAARRALRARRARRLVPAVAAVLVLVAGLGVATAVLRGGGATAPEATPQASPGPTAPADGLTTLTLPGSVQGRCGVPSADLLATQEAAFQGVVTAVDPSGATLQVERVFTGDVADVVQVAAPSDEMASLLGAARFEPGARYLVSATDGRLTLCGYTAPADDGLLALYEQAFPGATPAP